MHEGPTENRLGELGSLYKYHYYYYYYNASVEDEYNGLFKITLAALFCKTCKLLHITWIYLLWNSQNREHQKYLWNVVVLISQ